MATDQAYSNLEVARTLIEMFGLPGPESQYLEFVEDRLFNDKRYYIDPKELLALGWTPTVSWREGLEKTSKLFSYPACCVSYTNPLS